MWKCSSIPAPTTMRRHLDRQSDSPCDGASGDSPQMHSRAESYCCPYRPSLCMVKSRLAIASAALDALLLGFPQDVLDGRPRVSARSSDLRLRHAVGVVPQDVPVTHVLSHVVTPFCSTMRSSLPHPVDCRASMSPAGLDVPTARNGCR